MAKKPQLAPRRRPAQERSRAGVDAILQAASELLLKHGWRKLTTNKIAQRAGVNIASLYQFFPNKDAIVAELERRHVQETRVQAEQAFRCYAGGDGIRGRVRALVEAVVAVHAVAPELHRVFTDELPRRRRAPAEAQASTSAAGLSALGFRRPELSAWIIDAVVHAVVHEGMAQREHDLASGALTDELVDLIVPYLWRPPEASSTAGAQRK